MPNRPPVRDVAGFPMVWCHEVETYVHWLPITKIQFEYFLCDTPDASFDEPWYQDLLVHNPRVSPHLVTTDNYWQCLMTGLRPAEAQRFAAWNGAGFTLPDEDQWRKVLEAFRDEPPVDVEELFPFADGRLLELLRRVSRSACEACEEMGREPSQATQMLLELGAMEWVTTGSPASGWGARGEPVPAFCGSLEQPHEPCRALVLDPDVHRLAAAGARLFYRVPPSADGMKGSAA